MYNHGGAGQGNYYLLADPRLVEALDDGTIVQSTGAACSSPQTLALVNPPCSQRLRGDTSQGNGGGRRRRNKAGDMMDVSREASGGKSGNQGGEGRGQGRTTDRTMEVRSIKGGGRRATRWVTVRLP